MKDDAPAPDKIPQKRALLQDRERTPDLWLRQWLVRDDLHYRERRRISAEIERRKESRLSVRLAVIAGPEGVTPQQVRVARDQIKRIQPTEVRLVGQTVKMHRLFAKDLNAFVDYGDIHPEGDLARSLIRSATVVLAFPKERYKPTQVEGVWDAVRFAKHRDLPVRVILPDGSTTEGST